MQRNNNKLGAWIKQLRVSKKMKQRELAKEMGFPYPQYMANIESGRTPFPPKYVGRFCSIMGVSINDFVGMIVRDFQDQLMAEVLRIISKQKTRTKNARP